MRAPATGTATWVVALWALGACVPALAPAAWAEEYVQEDAKLSAKTLSFSDQDDKQVTVAQGNFRLQIGKHTLTGDNAVLWIQEIPAGETVRRKIVVYIEGRARAIEPDGAITGDSTMVVYVNQEGRLWATGKAQPVKLDKMPIYARAVEARTKSQAGPTGRPAPPLVRTPTTGPAGTTRPAKSTKGLTTRPTSGPAEETHTLQPVEFQAQEVLIKELTPTLRAIVLKGNVYLSQGTAHSAEFLELRAQAAVIFTEKGIPRKDVRSPMSAQLPAFGQNESVSGVYLEGDVLIARGERTLQSPRAYYDFTTDRALILNPVFRTIQEQRDIPIYIRAKEARMLSAREIYFENAKVTTSDFYTPSYTISAEKMYFKDITSYDANGKQIGEQKLETEMKHVTYRIEDLPLLYWPYLSGDFTESETPVRRLMFGHNGRFGTGMESEWDFFRLLGLLKPEGVRGGIDVDIYNHSTLLGVNFQYSRRTENTQYTGYAIASFVYDSRGKDKFGTEEGFKDIPAPNDRGRVLERHKEYLPNDWEVQFELSYLSDKNFLEEFYRTEYFAGKEQETLLYAKKQRDNWAFTSLLQYRLNDFQTQTESWPDLSFYLLGEPLADGYLTYFNEDHLGIKRYRAAENNPYQFPVPPDPTLGSSNLMGRGDTRNEIDAPLKAGPVNVTPYVTGRLTGWTDKPDGGKEFRPYGQAGVKSNMDIWRVYNDVQSRLWDVNRLKHIITPEVVGWVASTGGVKPDEIFPMDPGIEQDVTSTSGSSFGIYQRLQTKRGEPGKEQTVDWMRLSVVASFFDKPQNTLPSDGRFFFSRPEDSLARNAIDADYTWNISDATALLADANYDTDSGGFGRVDAGFAVQRNPRLRYYVGVRAIRDLHTTVGTFGFNYKLSPRYSLSFFDQYDFNPDSQQNQIATVSVIRKFERWYGAVSFEYDRSQGSFGLYVTIWPEGVPEVKVGTGNISPLGSSSQN